VKLSIVIPAYNEAKRIEACLQSVFAALRANARPELVWEVIVVDNNSTDQTAELARRAGARVIFEPVNHIARARNAGASMATGEWLLFLDADTLLPAETLTDTLAKIQHGGVVGGGSILNYGKAPAIKVRLFVLVCNLVIRSLKMTGGCFLFCRAEAFREVGGFNEAFFAGEDAEFGKALKRWGREHGLTLAILHRHPVLTSDRKFHLYGLNEILLAITRYLLFPQRTMTNKRYLDIFYDGRR
jgi:glycosyltransferase involved in cell wall biosynthesis